MILNVGAGDDSYGDVRADLYRGPHVDVLFDVEHGIPFKGNVFSVVYSRNLLEHVKNVFAVLDEMKRVLKMSGFLVLTTDNAAYLPYHVYRKSVHCGMGYKGRGKEDKHYLLFTKDHLLNFMAALQLEVVECSYVGLEECGGKKTARFPMRAILGLLDLVGPWTHMAYPRLRLVAKRAD